MTFSTKQILNDENFYQPSGETITLRDYQLHSSIITYTGTTAPNTFAPITSSIISKSSNYTIQASDQNKIIECNGTFTITLSNSMITGMQLDIVNVGTGIITIAASTTLLSAGTKLATQYTGASIYHRGSNIWLAVGRLTA